VLFNVGRESGVLVADLESGGRAAIAGVQRGDIITKVNNETIKSSNDLERRIADAKTPSQIRLEVIKRGKPLTIVIDLP
jgi:serine protease DegQ